MKKGNAQNPIENLPRTRRPPASRCCLLGQTVAEDQGGKENSLTCAGLSRKRARDSKFLVHMVIEEGYQTCHS